MTYHIGNAPVNVLRRNPPPRMAEASHDVLVELSAALAPGWDVEQATDYLGEVSFVALPVGDDSDAPAFILYEKDGTARVATMHGDDWEDDLVFTTCQQAINRITDGALVFQADH